VVEVGDVEDDAFARCSVADPLDPNMVGGLGHVPSLASGERRATAVASPDMQAILFDWDGTLVDSLGAFHSANAAVMASFGLPFDEIVYRRNYLPDWRLMYIRLGVPGDRLDEANELWHASFAAGADVVAFDGVVAALERLRDAGSRLGIVTAGDRAIVVPQVERTGLAELLETRVFGDDLDVHKPDPAPLRKALELLDLADRPEDAAYVGDAPTDMQMARAVGVRAIGITSVLGDPDELREAGAEEISASVSAWVDEHLATVRPVGG
jgi:HAD superfamily hydrolase (TIGR01509 family)